MNMNMKLPLLLSLAGSLATSALAALVSDDCVSVKATVTVPIVRGDLDTSRQTALVHARRECVKTALNTKVLDPAAYAQNAAAIEQNLLQSPDAYVARCQVDSEDVVDDGENYRLTAVADVRAASLKAALVEQGFIEPVALADKPRVLVLIRERFDTRITGTRYCETQLARDLQQKGFKVVDADQKQILELRERTFAEVTGDRVALLKSATDFPADYLLVGEVAVTSSAPLAGTDLKGRFANLSLKIVDSMSGTVLATVTGEGRSRHIDELTGGNWAMDDALKAAGPELFSQFQAVLKQQITQGAPITVDFYGLDQPGQREQAQKQLAGVDRVAGVTRRFYVPGVTQFEVRFKGPASELSAALQKLAVDGQPVEVQDTTARCLRLSCGSPALKAGAEALLERFTAEKFKDFDTEKLRAADHDLIAQINELAKDTRVNDEQRKELYAARQAMEEKERELVRRTQELAQREQEAKTAGAEYARVQAEPPAPAHPAQPAGPATHANPPPPTQTVRASQRAYVAEQNLASAQSNAGLAAADNLAGLNDGLRTINTVASGFSNVAGTLSRFHSSVGSLGAALHGFGF